MAKVTVQYIKSYYKTTTKDIEIPDEVDLDDAHNWIHENSVKLFEDDIASASLNFEDDEVNIIESEADFTVEDEDEQKQRIIDKINAIIEKYDDFTTADVEADSSPFLESEGKLCYLMEEFTIDGGRVYVYDPSSYTSEEIDKYDADYHDLSLSQVEYVLELAEKWAEYND